jgi:hypothetical protein
MRLPVLVLILGSCWSSSGAMINLSILPPPISVTTGQSIDFMLQISGHTPGAAPSVGAFDLTVGFDQTLLTPTAVAFGPFLGNTALFEALTSSSLMPSQVNVAEVSLLPSTTLDALQPAIFSLATLTFSAKKSGTASLGFTAGVVDDAFGNKLASVPEPGALWLVALPVLALVIGCRRWRLRQIATGYIR